MLFRSAALLRLGNADASTPVGGLEAHGKVIQESLDGVARSLDGIAAVLNNVAQAIRETRDV